MHTRYNVLSCSGGKSLLEMYFIGAWESIDIIYFKGFLVFFYGTLFYNYTRLLYASKIRDAHHNLFLNVFGYIPEMDMLCFRATLRRLGLSNFKMIHVCMLIAHVHTVFYIIYVHIIFVFLFIHIQYLT